MNSKVQKSKIGLVWLQKSRDQKTSFVKIHAPWEVLTRYAEILNFKMPLRVGITHGQENALVKKSMFFGDASSPF
jgi:hypothetical protein